MGIAGLMSPWELRMTLDEIHEIARPECMTRAAVLRDRLQDHIDAIHEFHHEIAQHDDDAPLRD